MVLGFELNVEGIVFCFWLVYQMKNRKFLEQLGWHGCIVVVNAKLHVQVVSWRPLLSLQL